MLEPPRRTTVRAHHRTAPRHLSVMRSPVALPPTRTGSVVMATADDYLNAIARCTCQAELTPNEEAKAMWLALAESYQLLLIAGKIKECGALIRPPIK